MSIVDFFDVNNIEHVKAYRTLCKTGQWPPSFWDHIEQVELQIPMLWQPAIASKLAEAYVNFCLENEEML
jgi:hypothetical protein